MDQPDPVQPKQVSTFLASAETDGLFRFSVSSTLQIHPNKEKPRPGLPANVTLRLLSAAKEIKYVQPIGSPLLGGKRAQSKCTLFLFVLTPNIVLLNDNLTMFTALMSDDAFSLFETMVNFSCCDENTLELSVDVQCHWWPGMSVVPCGKCQQRERRRIGNILTDIIVAQKWFAT